MASAEEPGVLTVDPDSGLAAQRAVVLVIEPDDSYDIGLDTKRLPKPPHLQRGIAQSQLYGTNQQHLGPPPVVRRWQGITSRRKRVFYVLLGFDFGYFLLALFFSAVGASNDSSQTTTSDGIVFKFYMPLNSFSVQECVISILVSAFGFIGTLHDKTILLSLFIILEIMNTALLTLRAISFLHLIRIAMIAVAFWLRHAMYVLYCLREFHGLARENDLQTMFNFWRAIINRDFAAINRFGAQPRAQEGPVPSSNVENPALSMEEQFDMYAAQAESPAIPAPSEGPGEAVGSFHSDIPQAPNAQAGSSGPAPTGSCIQLVVARQPHGREGDLLVIPYIPGHGSVAQRVEDAGLQHVRMLRRCDARRWRPEDVVCLNEQHAPPEGNINDNYEHNQQRNMGRGFGTTPLPISPPPGIILQLSLDECGSPRLGDDRGAAGSSSGAGSSRLHISAAAGLGAAGASVVGADANVKIGGRHGGVPIGSNSTSSSSGNNGDDNDNNNNNNNAAPPFCSIHGMLVVTPIAGGLVGPIEHVATTPQLVGPSVQAGSTSSGSRGSLE